MLLQKLRRHGAKGNDMLRDTTMTGPWPPGRASVTVPPEMPAHDYTLVENPA